MAERPVSESTDRPPSKATDEQRPAGGDLLALPAGYAINEYRIDRVLGCGGFGITYLAHDTHLDCPVAIKEYLPREMAGRDPGLAVRPHSGASAKSFGWGLERFSLKAGRSPASTIGHRARYAISAPTRPPYEVEYESGEPLTNGWPVSGSTARCCCAVTAARSRDHPQHRLSAPRHQTRNITSADGSPVLDFGSRAVSAWRGRHLLTRWSRPALPPPSSISRTASRGHGPTSTPWPA
jgi:hypothetical protein